MSILIVHITLAVGFFYILNWIGRHTVSLGYIKLSIFVRQDEAPAFNFILRTASPTVYIIILSAGMYASGYDYFVKDIWHVVLFYLVFRALFNVTFSRAMLINWQSFIVQSVVAVALSYFLYDKVILTKKYILPDINTMANELWLVIILFLYSVLNRVQTSNEGARRRKLCYLKEQYFRFKMDYGEIVSKSAINEHIQYLAYAIMIYENFGRPKVVRLIEGLIPRKALTRGIMQVRSTKKISDKESVIIAMQKLNHDFNVSLENIRALKQSWMKKREESELEEIFINKALREAIVSYNKDEDYVTEVQLIVEELKSIDKKNKKAKKKTGDGC